MSMEIVAGASIPVDSGGPGGLATARDAMTAPRRGRKLRPEISG